MSNSMENTQTTGVSDNQAKKKKVKFYETWTFLIIVCIIMPIAFRSLVYAPFHIPSGSMKSTLLIGDYIFVNKFAYGYSRYSFPFGFKWFDGRISSQQPKRGDVIVFRPPPKLDTDYIKRLIGMPGDTVQMRKGELYINDQLVPRRRIDDYIEENRDGSVVRIERYIEALPGGVEHIVLDQLKDGPYDNTPVFKVPAGHYFFMGDNRDNSADSRTTTVGYVPEVNLVGRAELIFLSTSSEIWKIWEWPFSLRSGRFMLSIKDAQNPQAGGDGSQVGNNGRSTGN